MEAKFINKPSDGPVLSSQLGNLYVSTDMPLVCVRIKDATGAVLLDEPYYPASGQLTVYDPAELIEQRMRDTGETFARFAAEVYYKGAYHDDHEQTEVQVDETFDTASFGVLYCDAFPVGAVDDDWLGRNFLTPSQSRRLPAEADLTLTYFAREGHGADIAVWAVVKTPSGKAERVLDYERQNPIDADGCRTLPLNIPQTARDYLQGGARLLMLTAEAGDRSFTVYIDNDATAPRETFSFRNRFNAPDAVSIPAVSTDKTEVKTSEASFSGRMVQYDRTVTRTRSVESLPMAEADLAAAEELCASHGVSRLPENLPVLVTESTCEFSDTDEKPQAVKLTWRYASVRPPFAAVADAGRFSSPYTPAFD